MHVSLRKLIIGHVHTYKHRDTCFIPMYVCMYVCMMRPQLVHRYLNKYMHTYKEYQHTFRYGQDIFARWHPKIPEHERIHPEQHRTPDHARRAIPAATGSCPPGSIERLDMAVLSIPLLALQWLRGEEMKPSGKAGPVENRFPCSDGFPCRLSLYGLPLYV